MIRKDKNWYLPYPPTLSMSFSRGVNWKAESSLELSGSIFWVVEES
jgi:hypothetical protein